MPRSNESPIERLKRHLLEAMDAANKTHPGEEIPGFRDAVSALPNTTILTNASLALPGEVRRFVLDELRKIKAS